MPYANQLDTNMTSYDGSMEAYVFAPPGLGPVNVIRTDQTWGVRVKWEMDGALVTWLNANFQIQVVLERMGPGPDVALPIVLVNSLTGTLTTPPPPLPPTRNYVYDVNVAAGAVAIGIYRLVVALHLLDDTTGNPTPIAGFADCGFIDVFQA